MGTIRNRALAIFTTAAVVAVGAGCSLEMNRERPVANGDAGPAGAAYSDGGVFASDLGPPPTSTLVQMVTSRLLLPTGGQDYARDIDNNGSVDNQIGKLLGTLSTYDKEFDLQKALDDDVADGSTVVLFDLLADAGQEARARLVVNLGEDANADPSDNFSGVGEFRIANDSIAGVFLDGRLSEGRLTAVGRMLLPLTVGGKPQLIALEQALFEGSYQQGKVTGGKITGVVRFQQIDELLLPELAEKINAEYVDPTTDASLVTTLRDLFDTDRDNQITVAELKGNALVGLLIAPDIDTDGDGKRDSLSFGFGVEAVSCTITR